MNQQTASWLATIPGTSLWRQHNNADGTPKIAFTEVQARDKARRLEEKDGEPMDAYPCRCGAWHVGRARR